VASVKEKAGDQKNYGRRSPVLLGYWRYMAAVLVLSTIVAVYYLSHTYNETVTLTEEQFHNEQSLVARQTALGIHENILCLVRELEFLSGSSAVKNMDLEKTQALFEKTMEHVEHYHANDIALLDSRGIVMITLNAPPLVGKDFSFRGYYKQARALKNRTTVYELIDFRGSDFGKKGIMMAMPLFTGKEKFAGAALITVDINELISGFAPDNPDESNLALIDQNGIVLYHPSYEPGTDISKAQGIDISFRAFLEDIKHGRPFEGSYLSPDGIKTHTSSYPLTLGENKLSVMIYGPEMKFKEGLAHFSFEYTVTVIMLFILFASLIASIVYQIFRWNRELQEEISERRKAEEDLRKSEKKYSELYNYMGNGVAVYEATENGEDFVFIDFNKGGERIDKIKRESVIGKRVTETFPGIEELGLLDVFKRVWKTGNPEHHPTSLYKDKRIVGFRENYVYKLPSGEIVAIYDDVTERKKAEDEIKLKSTVLDSVSDSVFMHTFDGKFHYVNEAAYKSRGYTYEELLDVPLYKLDVPEYAEKIKYRNEELLQRGESIFESAHYRKDGSIMPMEVHSRTMDVDGDKVILSVARDITERKNAEEALRESERRFRGSFENAAIGASMVDLRGNFIGINRRFCDMLGYSENELLTKSFSDVTLPDDIPLGLQHMTEMIEGKSDYTSFEKRYVRKDGQVLNIIVSPALIRSGDGKPLHFVAMFQDITEHKKTEDILRANAAIFSNLTEGIYLVGLDDMTIKWTNPVFESMFGYEPGEMIGKPVDIVNAPSDKTPTETRQSIADDLKKDGEWHGVVENIKKDGTHFWCYANVSLFDHPQFGKVIVSVHSDITERKKAEEDIKLKSMLLDSALDSVVLHSKDGKLIYVNEAFCKSHGYTNDEVFDIPLNKLDVPEHAEHIKHRMEKLLQKGELVFETAHYRKDGSIFPMDVHARTLEINGH
jgi:PAS domain S-box-containing protein